MGGKGGREQGGGRLDYEYWNANTLFCAIDSFSSRPLFFFPGDIFWSFMELNAQQQQEKKKSGCTLGSINIYSGSVLFSYKLLMKWD